MKSNSNKSFLNGFKINKFLIKAKYFNYSSDYAIIYPMPIL